MMTTSSMYGTAPEPIPTKQPKQIWYGTDVKIKKVHPDAKIPVYSSKGAAAFDLFSVESGWIVKGFAIIFDTGLQIEIPENHVLMIFSRSGHGFKNNVRLSNCVGILDSDYRGNIMCKLIQDENEKDEEFSVKVGDRIAQGIILPYPKINFIEVKELTETERGENGFGSTGK